MHRNDSITMIMRFQWKFWHRYPIYLLVFLYIEWYFCDCRLYRLINISIDKLEICHVSTLCLKNDTDVAHCSFNAHQPILVIFGRDIAAWVHNYVWFVIPSSFASFSALPVETWTPEIGSLQSCCIPKITLIWLAITFTFIQFCWSCWWTGVTQKWLVEKQ